MKNDNNFFDINKGRYDNILIDTNLLYHKNYHVFKHMVHEVYPDESIVTGGIYGFIKSLKCIERDLLKDDGKIFFLFDNPDSKYNMRQLSIDPMYKANRKRYSDAFYKGLNYLRLILMDYKDGYVVIYGTGFEADDLAPNVINKIPNNESILCVSEDLDWARLIDYGGKNVDIYRDKKIFNKKEFNEKYNFMPSEDNIILYKVLRGDSSDNIPVGVPNISSKLVEKIIGNYKDIFELIDDIDIISFLSDKWKNEFKKRKGRLRLNHQLVSFIPVDDSYIKQFTFKSKYRPKNLYILYKSVNFDPVKVDDRMQDIVNAIENKKKVADDNDKVDSFFRIPKAER